MDRLPHSTLEKIEVETAADKPETADLAGNNLQLYISKILPALVKEEWPPEIRSAVTRAFCEVQDHERGLVTSAFVGNSIAIATDQLAVEAFRWPPKDATSAGYHPIADRTVDGIEATIRDHLRYMEPQIRMAMQRRGVL